MGLERTKFPIGSRILGRYEVLRALGEGGMGTVVLVKDLELDGELSALKILGKEHVADATQLGRFRNEVVLARKLSHPNIVRVYDFGMADGGVCFINMEYVDGGGFSQMIKGRSKKAFSFEAICINLAQVCSALFCAHSQGVVHRDLKPDNLLLSSDGLAKVTDFGLARLLESDSHFTLTGETVGTPFYMSPEQLAGETLDHRADIYALGILTYELVVGKRPFASENYLELAHMHMTKEVPSIGSTTGSLEPWQKWLNEFIRTCTAKSPGNRFSDASEALLFLARHSEAVLQSKLVRMPPPQRSQILG